MAIVKCEAALAEYGPMIERLFSNKWIGDSRVDPATPLFRQPTWHELGFPFDLWRASMLFGAAGEESDDVLALKRAWTAWMETVGEIGTGEITIVRMPIDTGDPERRTAAIAPLQWESILRTGHELEVWVSNEWVVFDNTASWAMRCHWESLAVLGASTEWMRCFRMHYGSHAPLKTMFDEYIDWQFGTGLPNDLYQQTGEAIKAGIRWPNEQATD